MDVSQRIAVSGMLAHQRLLDVISSNLANAGTTGFKRARAHLADLQYDAGVSAAVGPNGENVRFVGVGQGVQLADVRHDFVPGVFQTTGNALDLALDGDGFFAVALPSGQVGYTRDGSFRLDGEGRLVTVGGYPVRAADGSQLRVPADAVGIRVDAEGQLWSSTHDEAGGVAEQAIGRFGVARFRNNDGLLANGENIWLASEASGAAREAQAGANGAPGVLVGALETSNVDVADEFTRLLQAQRGYQLNLRVVQAWDEVGRMANDLRR